MEKALVFIRALMIPLLVSVCVITGYGIYAGLLQMVGNFHTVVPGQVYRSAQPDAESLEAYARHYHIRSVINLRGENEDREWYRTEVHSAALLGIQHYDFRMSAKHPLSEDQAMQLIQMMRDAPKPLLIHCLHGADRSGLAAALYVAAVAHGNEDIAGKQLSMLYGHLPFSFARGYEMTESFDTLKLHLDRLTFQGPEPHAYIQPSH